HLTNNGGAEILPVIAAFPAQDTCDDGGGEADRYHQKKDGATIGRHDRTDVPAHTAAGETAVALGAGANDEALHGQERQEVDVEKLRLHVEEVGDLMNLTIQSCPEMHHCLPAVTIAPPIS